MSINGELQGLDAIPGTYLNLSRRWSSGDRIEVDMPFSFRVEGTIDDPTIQSVYYGPILLAAQADPVGQDPEPGFLEVSLYQHLKLDGDLARAIPPTDRPLHFTLNGLNMAPFFVADPVDEGGVPLEGTRSGQLQGTGRRGPPTQPYHLYFRRQEPSVVFGSVDAGVPNTAGPDGATFLDTVWAEAPFPNHEDFLHTVERVAADWTAGGAFTPAQAGAVLEAALGAEEDLQT